MMPFEAGVSGAELFFVISGIVIFYRPLTTRQDQEPCLSGRLISYRPESISSFQL